MFDAGSNGILWYNNSGFPGYLLDFSFSGTHGQWYIARPSTNVWASVAFAYDSSDVANDPTFALDGSIVSSTEFAAPVGTANPSATAYTLGNAGSGIRVWDGRLCEFAVWTDLLSNAELLAYTRGVSPLLIRPSALVEYIPMLRNNGSAKLAAPSVTGTAVQNHPRVIYPARPQIVTAPSSVVAPGVTFPMLERFRARGLLRGMHH
jgi:hypothetical protein